MLPGVGRLQWEVPPLGTPFALRRCKDAAIVLDDFRPTHLDAWVGRAVVLPAAVQGVPSDAPDLLPGDPEGALVAQAVVVRHTGNLVGRSPWFGVRRRRLDHLIAADPPDEPLLGVVIEVTGATILWVRGKPDEVATTLSGPDWRAATG